MRKSRFLCVYREVSLYLFLRMYLSMWYLYMASTSVFDVSNSSVSFYLDNMLDEQSKTYYKVISLSAMPPGPLANMVATRRFPPLSEFQRLSPWDVYGSSCRHVLLRYPKGTVNASSISNLMSQNDIPSLFAYLTSNGYQVQTELSKMISDQGLHSGSASSRKFICFASYSG